MPEQTRTRQAPVQRPGGRGGDVRSAWPSARSLTRSARGSFATRVGTQHRPVLLPKAEWTTEELRHRVEADARDRLKMRLRGVPVP